MAGEGMRQQPRGHRGEDAEEVRRARAKGAGFATILSDLFDPRPGLQRLAAPDTILCRCEDVTAGAVDAAVAGGADTMSALKIVTRCGMGNCQGRYCEPLVCRLFAAAGVAPRAPLTQKGLVRPVRAGDLVGA